MIKYYTETTATGHIHKKCSVDCCENHATRTGLCGKHYAQVRRHGKVFERTVFDPNDIVEHKGSYGIILRNKRQEKIGEAIINKEDIELVSQYSWCLNSSGYAITSIKGKITFLHQILNPDYEYTDHKDRDRLNNKRTNLRECTKSENAINIGLRKDNITGKTGVSWNKGKNKWKACITKNAKQFHLGYFKNINDAIKARRCAEKEYFGEFAPTY